MSYSIPNEGITGYRAQLELDQQAGIQSFIEGLTDEQRRRFTEIAHHLVYVGFEEGSRRYYDGFTDEQKVRQLTYEAELFTAGAGEFHEYLEELGKEQ